MENSKGTFLFGGDGGGDGESDGGGDGESDGGSGECSDSGSESMLLLSWSSIFSKKNYKYFHNFWP